MYDIVIIGAGVSGVFTALGLLGSGKKSARHRERQTASRAAAKR